MTIAALIEKGGLARFATATPATPATGRAPEPVTVASVANVAVAGDRRAEPTRLKTLPEPTAANDEGAASVPPTAEADNAPHYRWLIIDPDSRRREVCTLPEMTRSELELCYPGRRLVPLPDLAAPASVLLDQWDAA